MSAAFGKAFGKPKKEKKKALPPLLPSPQRKVTPAAPGFLANSPVTPFLRNKSSRNEQEEEQPAYLTFYVAQLPTTPILATDSKKALKIQCDKIKLIVRKYFEDLGMNVVGKVELKQADPDQLPTGATIQVFNKMSEADLVVHQGNHYLASTKGGSFEIAVGLLGQKWGVANPAVPGIASCTPRTWANTRPSPVAPIINKPSAVTALHTAVQIGNNQVRALRQVKQILGGGWFSGGGESSPAAPKDYVNAKDGLGWTALMKAASMGREMIVAHLIDSGADRTLVTGSARMHQKPRSAYDIAVQGFQSETCKALLQPGFKSLAQVKQFIYRDYKFDDIVDEPAAAPAEEEAAPAEEEDNKMTIDGDWELGNGTAGFGDVTTISGENGKMMAAGEEIGTYTFKELDDVVAGFKGEITCELINGDVEGKLSEDGNELELTVTIAFVSVTAKFNRKGGEEAAPADEEAAPADEEAAPADEEAAPADEEAAPADEEAAPEQ